MGVLDVIILAPLAYFGFRGFMNGFVKEILNIVGIILAVFITFRYMDALVVLIKPLFDEKSAAIPFISGIILFIGTLLLVALAAHYIKKTLEAAKLGTANRLLGMSFGILKSGILVSSVLLLLAGFNFPSDESRQQSFFYTYVIHLGPLAYDALALLAPGTDSYSDTIEEILSEYNPIENFPLLNN